VVKDIKRQKSLFIV